MPTALIVEDDASSLEALSEIVRLEGFDVESGGTLREARNRLETREFDLVFLDLQLPDGNGMDVLPEMLESPRTDVVMITGHATVATAVDALRQGATDYLVKPLDMARLKRLLNKAATTASLRREVDELRGELRRLGRFGLLIGSTPAMQRVYDLITRVAPTNATVLVTGPTGCGKELTALMVHRLSRRVDRPFVPINCASVPATLIESELFGHEKGSFTGADRDRRGVFERADGGTLFLDEVTEMPAELQVKLLRVLETSTFSRIGGERQRHVDVRLVAATNRDPRQAVADGKLREDLLYRLNVFPIELPSLRERRGDVVMLAQHFLDEQNRRSGAAKRFTDEALDQVRNHPWPGNVRELKNAVERAFILAGPDGIEPRHFPFDERVTPVSADGLWLEAGTTIAEAERLLILATLDKVDGSRKEAAELLGISQKTLYNRLKQYEDNRQA